MVRKIRALAPFLNRLEEIKEGRKKGQAVCRLIANSKVEILPSPDLKGEEIQIVMNTETFQTLKSAEKWDWHMHEAAKTAEELLITNCKMANLLDDNGQFIGGPEVESKLIKKVEEELHKVDAFMKELADRMEK